MGGSPGLGAYQSAKFAVEGFSEVLNNEVKPFGVKVTIVEPGAFRTDWAGSSMHIPQVGPDYEQTVGAMNHRRAGFDRSAPPATRPAPPASSSTSSRWTTPRSASSWARTP
ncbi:SDR family NAD(P)-dependent oxidoreductase [Nonomuraea salmonea]|uniref:SDR family NAD(P)-dependent oxidoreductase n=1 Tax=Nonomuraea salmonea TaxID=46181 RepID=UPI003CD0BC5A